MNLICRLLIAGFVFASPVFAGDGNRLTYLDENNPWYPHKDFPKLTTPQWVGEEGVEAVVILAIDDMRDIKKYEEYLRPILIRLKQIDGRAPVSIMTCNVDPKDEHLQQWLAEGLSIEVHTVDHPCPLLQGGDFKKAKSTYDRCVDLLNQIPNNKPVAIRMPCCDSLNTVSPRFFSEIFNKTTEKGNYLQASSSVFNIFTSDDHENPRDLVLEKDGSERFLKYIPKNLNRGGAVFNTFVNTIENYPYPYVINRLCWEFPCVVPSDWEAQHLHGKNNPKTVADMKAALDITVHKQGVMNLVFHPHGWIRNDQIVELIDHAVKTHGKKVKFLTFKEAVERLNTGLGIGGFGTEFFETGHRVLDVNNDGYMDVIRAGAISMFRKTPHPKPLTRIWFPEQKKWKEISFPVPLMRDAAHNTSSLGPRFGVLRPDGNASFILNDGWSDSLIGIWHFDGKKWTRGGDLKKNLTVDGRFDFPATGIGVRLRDLENDGICELIVGTPIRKLLDKEWPAFHGVFQFDHEQNRWKEVPYKLPGSTTIAAEVSQTGLYHPEAGLRFVDINEDGHDDIVFSNHERYGIWLFKDMQTGWSIEVMSGKRSADDSRKQQGADASRSPLPPIIRKDGSDNGFFVHSRHLFWQNEDTAHLPDLVDRRSFDDLLKNIQPGPKTPNASLNSIRTRPGFKVELVAAEPLVMDPVAFEWGADGKLWVVEMADYPLGRDGKGTPGGRVRYLEDTNGDGQYDKSTLFLENVRFPNGILPWKKGVIVTAAPDVFYAEDTDGDGKADKREVLITGFAEGNQQHRVNGLVYGLDNWVYLANGDSGGVIKRVKASGRRKPPVGQPRSLTPNASKDSNTTAGSRRPLAKDPINIGSMDLRLKPDTGEIDLQAGRTQFGRNRDDWGNWFGSNNSNPMWHYVLADHYIRRNKHFASPDGRVHVSVAPGPSPCFPISRTLERFNDFDKANRFTSACSAIVYRDELFGPNFIGNMFVSEPVHNLVHREVMQPKGYTFTSRRAADEQQSEFLASSDNWFRPTMIKTGPDGALWIADMYRHVIEHPKWIPEEWQKRLNLRAGDDRGRIYRVVPVKASGGRKPPVGQDRSISLDASQDSKAPAGLRRPLAWRLDDKTTEQLVETLHSSNGWKRDTAQRLLIERNDPTSIMRLKWEANRKAHEKDNPTARTDALGRIHALCTLDGLNAIEGNTLLFALNDSHPGVRRHAARLCGRLENPSPRVINSLITLTNDNDPQVRLQVAYTLGDINYSGAGVALGKLLLAHGDDRFLRAAVISSLNEKNVERVTLTVLSSPNTKQAAAFTNDLMQMAAAFGKQATMVGLLHKATASANGQYEAWQLSAVAGLLNTLGRQRRAFTQLRNDKSPLAQQSLAQLSKLLTFARVSAASNKLESSERVTAIRLLGNGLERNETDITLLASLLAPQQPVVIQQTAVKSLVGIDDASVPQTLLNGWRTYGPELRGDVLDALMSREASLTVLLDAIEQKKILARDFDAARRQKLLAHRTADIRSRAKKLFAADLNSNRQQLIVKYQSATTLSGDRLRGAELFKKHCSGCHKLAGVGVVVGPDLKSLTDKSPGAMLVAMLDPNRAVERKYISYTAITTDGRTFNGLLAAESGNSITLKEAKGKTHTILRTDLEELVSSSKSTMPEGLEKELKPQDVADIIAHVRSNVPLPARKQFPGNEPTLVKADGDGALLLTPATGEIYGSTIVLEKKYGNLGYWNSADDHVVWNVDVPSAGRYTVTINYACNDSNAGDRWVISAADGSLEGAVKGTVTWDNYQSATVGAINLAAGRQRITMRPVVKPKSGALMDLKSVRLKNSKK